MNDYLWGMLGGFGIGVASVLVFSRDIPYTAYAVYPVADEDEALEKLKEAYSHINPKVRLEGFEEGYLIQTVEKNTIVAGVTAEEEEHNKCIGFFKFSNLTLLAIKLYEDHKMKKPCGEGMKLHEYLSNPQP